MNFYKGMELIYPQIQNGISIDDNIIGSASISVEEKIKLLKEDFNALVLPASPYITPMSEIKQIAFMKEVLSEIGYSNSATVLATVGTNVLDTIEEYICKTNMDRDHSKEAYISTIKEALLDIKNNSTNEGSHFFNNIENQEFVEHLLSSQEQIENIFNFYNDSERFSLTSGWNDKDWNTSSFELIYKNIPEEYKEIVDFTKEHENESKFLKNQLFHYAFNKEYYPGRQTDLSEITAAYEITKSLCHESESIDFVKIPFVAVNWSESDKFKSGEIFSIKDFDNLTREVDNSNYEENQGKLYNKLKFTIYMGANRTYTDRMDLGDGFGGLIEFLNHYHKQEIIEELNLSDKEPEINNEEKLPDGCRLATPDDFKDYYLNENDASIVLQVCNENNTTLLIDEENHFFEYQLSGAFGLNYELIPVEYSDIINDVKGFLEEDFAANIYSGNELTNRRNFFDNLNITNASKSDLLSEKYNWISNSELVNYMEATGTPMSEELASSIADLFDEYNEALVIDENGNIFTRDCSDSKTDTEQDISAVTQTDIIQKMIEFIETDLNEINPDDDIYKNKEKLLSEIQDWQEKASQSNLLEKDKPQFVSFDNIPEYAIGYLEYGETDGLSEEDIKNIEDFLTKEHLGDLVSLDSPDRSFSSNPAFGLPSDCVSATFSVLSKEQVHEKVVSEGRFEIKSDPIFSDFQFDFSRPVTWHNVDKTSIIYADTRITQEMAESLYKMAGMESAYNPDMAYCIQYRCSSTNKANLVYLCKVDPMADITSPQPDVKLPDELIKRVMKGVEDGIISHKEQHHNLPGYLYEATGIAAPERNINRYATGRKPVPVKPAVKQETSSIDFGVTAKGKLKIKAKENYTIDNSLRDKLRVIGYKYDSFSQAWTCNNTEEAQKATLDIMKDNFPLDFDNYMKNQSSKITEAIETKKSEQNVNIESLDNSANKLWENIRTIMDQDAKGSNKFNGKPYGAFVYLYKNANMIERRNIEKLLPPKTVRDPVTGSSKPLSQDEYAKQVNNLIWTKTYPERFTSQGQTSPAKQVLKDKEENNPSLS